MLGVGGEQWDDGSAASGSDSGSEDERNRKLGVSSLAAGAVASLLSETVSAEDPVYWYAGAGFSRRFEMPPYQSDAAASYLEGHLEAPLPSGSYEAGNRAYRRGGAGLGRAHGPQRLENHHGRHQRQRPAFAGVVSLQRPPPTRRPPDPRLPPPAPRAPAAAAAASSGATTAAMFKDIMVGNSSVGGAGYQCGNGFEATTGWDAITGWGSPRWEGPENLATDGHLRAAGTRR